MIESKDVAASVNSKLRNCYQLLEESIVEVNRTCDEEQAKSYRQKIGSLFTILVFDLMEPLYQAHPELKPSDWED
jgi:hypothetical protein